MIREISLFFYFISFNHKRLSLPMMTRHIIAFLRSCLQITNVIVEFNPQCSSFIYRDACSVCNFQTMKSPVELNSLYQNSFLMSPGLLYHLIRRESGRLANEAFTSNSIVSLRQWLNGLKITNCVCLAQKIHSNGQ